MAHCVNTRLVVTRREFASQPTHRPSDFDEPPHQQTHTVRQLHVAWSPRLPNQSTRFEVRADGVFGTEGVGPAAW